MWQHPHYIRSNTSLAALEVRINRCKHRRQNIHHVTKRVLRYPLDRIP